MAANGQPLVKVDLDFIQKFNAREHAYMAYEGYMEKFVYSHAFSSTYEIHTPSGIKRVKYDNLQIYVPLDVYEASEEKERTRVAAYKLRITLDGYEYDHLVQYFPDEKDKWERVEETKTMSGKFGMPEEQHIIKYKRISRGGGGRRKQKKESRKNKRRTKLTRRR